MRATTCYVGIRGTGIAYEFWLRVERERASRGMTKVDMWNAMKARAGDGLTPARSTIDNLRDSTRAPAPRIVKALADVLDIPWAEAQELAGLVPRSGSSEIDVRDAISRSSSYTKDEKQALLRLLDVLDAAKSNRPSGRESA
jgi:hypothetical protein